MKTFTINLVLPVDYKSFLENISNKNFGIENSKIIREALYEYLVKKGYSPSDPKSVRCGRPINKGE